MSGTKAGWLNAKKTMIERMGSEEALHEHFQRIGSLGGKKSTGGGFAANPELASRAGKIGGSISRRGKKGESHAK